MGSIFPQVRHDRGTPVSASPINPIRYPDKTPLTGREYNAGAFLHSPFINDVAINFPPARDESILKLILCDVAYGQINSGICSGPQIRQ
jgi:hypothetical protein